MTCPYQLEHDGVKRGFFEAMKPEAKMEAAIAAGSCLEVVDEIKKRYSEIDGWATPHGGSYRNMHPHMNINNNAHPHVMELEHIDRLGVVTSRVAFTFMWSYSENKDNEYCRVFGCSQSQGYHVSDHGKNYCNLRN